jgi:hypothetical protein
MSWKLVAPAWSRNRASAINNSGGSIVSANVDIGVSTIDVDYRYLTNRLQALSAAHLAQFYAFAGWPCAAISIGERVMVSRMVAPATSSSPAIPNAQL